MRAVWPRELVALAAVVLVGAAIRGLAILAGPGYPFDIVTFQGWAARLAALGPGAFYDPTFFADYPPGLLTLLWLAGVAFGGDVPAVVIRSLSIPFDLAIAVVLFAAVRRVASDRAALGASALYALNPAIVLAGPYWGQLDAVPELPLLLALVAGGSGRLAAAGALGAIAALTKPQMAVGLAVLGVYAATLAARDRGLRPLASFALGAVAAAFAIAAPFALTAAKLGALARDATATHPFTSLFAFNLWALVTGFFVSDDVPVLGLPARLWGAALFLVATIAIARWLVRAVRRGASTAARDVPLLVAAAAMLAFALYELPTRIHERYLFTAFALLAPFAAVRRTSAIGYVTLSVVFGISVLFSFTHQAQTGVVADPLLERTVFDPSALVLFTIALAAAVVVIVRSWVREPPSFG